MAHADASGEIRRLELSHQCKRRAEEEDVPLRQIFDDICRTSGDTAQQLSFSDLEASMYKRRRRATPALPTTSAEADAAVRSSRYAQLSDGEFYRGLAEAGENGSALVFASDAQLELLRCATQIYFDATFKVVPTIYYQLFTLFVPFADSAFPVLYALMSRKTQALYVKVFQKVLDLVPEFAPTCAMADFEEASVAAFQQVFPAASAVGCWFHYAQSLIKRTNKIGLKDVYGRNADVNMIVHCLMSLPLLPPTDITDAMADIQEHVNDDSPHANQLRQLISYVRRQWINKRSVGPERLSVRDNHSRTNNVLESYHAALRRRIKVSHPNLYSFLAHLQQATTDQMNDVARIRNGLNIRRPKKKANMLNDKRIKACMSRFSSGAYTRMQFLSAVSHSMGAHTEALRPTEDSSSSSDEAEETEVTTATATTTTSSASNSSVSDPPAQEESCEVCLVAPRQGFALVPCGHARFCESCALRVAELDAGCPVCRAQITMVMRIFQ